MRAFLVVALLGLLACVFCEDIEMKVYGNTDCSGTNRHRHQYSIGDLHEGEDGKYFKIRDRTENEYQWQRCESDGSNCTTLIDLKLGECKRISQIESLSLEPKTVGSGWDGESFDLSGSALFTPIISVILTLAVILTYIFN
jgi:hypothetical protein